MEISDEDVIESTPAPRSGTYSLESLREPHDEPRGDDLTDELARLSSLAVVPRLRGAVDWSDLAPSEAWVVSLAREGMPLGGILQTSPLGYDATLRVLATLISARVITLGG